MSQSVYLNSTVQTSSYTTRVIRLTGNEITDLILKNIKDSLPQTENLTVVIDMDSLGLQRPDVVLEVSCSSSSVKESADKVMIR